MTFGVLWTLTAVGIVVFASPYVLRPTTDRSIEVGDRFVASVATGVVLGWLAVRATTAIADDLVSYGTAADVGYWLGLALGCAFYVGRARRRAFVPIAARLADVAPWVLATYGTFLALCWLREVCSSIGGVSGPGIAAEVFVGAGLMAAGVALHRAWPLSEGQRAAVAVLALAAARLALSPLHVSPTSRPASMAAGLMVVGGASSIAFARARRTRRFGQAQSPVDDPGA